MSGWYEDPVTEKWVWTDSSVPDPGAPDAQSRAYREMGPEDAVRDDELHTMISRAYNPLPASAHPADHLLLPDDYERERWDAGRDDPRRPA